MGDVYHTQAYAHTQPVMAVPVHSHSNLQAAARGSPSPLTAPKSSLNDQAIEDSFLTNDLGQESLFMDETIERSGNLFSQVRRSFFLLKART